MNAESKVAPITGKKILITGVTGWVGGPLAASLAATNDVYGAARFAKAEQRAEAKAAGYTPVRIDFANSDYDEVPDDLDLVLHFAVSKDPDPATQMRATAEGAGELMEAAKQRSDKLAAFFHCSSTAVYFPTSHEPAKEGDGLGDSHILMGMKTYSVAKIAAESVVRMTSRRLGVPTVIARLNVPYGDRYGWMTFHLLMMQHGMAVPVSNDPPTQFSPIHADDIAASIPYLLSLAEVGAETVNWGGNEVVSIEDWCTYMGELTGVTPTFNQTADMIPSVVCDLTKLNSTGFVPSVTWKEGIRRQVEAGKQASAG